MMRLVTFVQSTSGASDDDVCEWLSYGMMMNVAAAIDLPSIDAGWARLRGGRHRPDPPSLWS